jgi:calcineurin-like phosphoesterase family protein
MSVYFCSDLHLGHKNIAKFRGFVSSCEDNTRLIEEFWDKRIKKNDVVYCLGDAAFDQESLQRIGNWKGRKILIKGNHCDFVSSHEQLQVFEEIYGMLKYKGMWLTHCPIHPDEMRGKKGNLYGHTHNHHITKGWGPFKKLHPKYLNCCVDSVWKNRKDIFYSLDQVRTYFGN